MRNETERAAMKETDEARGTTREEYQDHFYNKFEEMEDNLLDDFQETARRLNNQVGWSVATLVQVLQDMEEDGEIGEDDEDDRVCIDCRNKEENDNWICRCDCGKELSVSGDDLKSGKVSSRPDCQAA
jgi:hypothetical protein